MPALFRKEKPLQLSAQHLFTHSNQFIGIEGEILWIFVSSPVLCFLGREIMPLLAGDLASSARHAQCRIDEK
jgi:hypothetical protein